MMRGTMRRLLWIAALIGGGYVVLQQAPIPGDLAPDAANTPLGVVLDRQLSGKQVSGTGKVSRILADDSMGSRHQRFILTLGTGQTLLIVHNIDLAPRVAGLATGDTVTFHGEYEWNAQGGLIHWTHHDPQGRHPDGWLEHKGRHYR
jgi:Protein of unknown function (DUF3465)